MNWISIKEKFPERCCELYLIYGGPPGPYLYSFATYEDNKWFILVGKNQGYDFSGDYDFKPDFVTHWMPLPKPPEDVA